MAGSVSRKIQSDFKRNSSRTSPPRCYYSFTRLSCLASSRYRRGLTGLHRGWDSRDRIFTNDSRIDLFSFFLEPTMAKKIAGIAQSGGHFHEISRNESLVRRNDTRFWIERNENSSVYNVGNIGKADGLGWREAKGIRLSCCLPENDVPGPPGSRKLILLLSRRRLPFSLFFACYLVPSICTVSRSTGFREVERYFEVRARDDVHSPRSFFLLSFCFYSFVSSLAWHLRVFLILPSLRRVK